MPRRSRDFHGMSWMITWPTGPWHLHDVMPGGTVFLVRVGTSQRIVWQTVVTRSFAVPYESIADLAAEVRRRWGVAIDTRSMNTSGFCIGWQAKPVALLDRIPQKPHATAPVAEVEMLDLDGFQSSEWMSTAFRQRWGLRKKDDTICPGRAPVGWFGLPT